MPQYEDFGENVDAHLLYASGLAVDEGLSIIRRRFDDGSWRKLPGPWLYWLGAIVHRNKLSDDERVTAIRAALVSAMVTGEVGREPRGSPKSGQA